MCGAELSNLLVRRHNECDVHAEPLSQTYKTRLMFPQIKDKDIKQVTMSTRHLHSHRGLVVLCPVADCTDVLFWSRSSIWVAAPELTSTQDGC